MIETIGQIYSFGTSHNKRMEHGTNQSLRLISHHEMRSRVKACLSSKNRSNAIPYNGLLSGACHVEDSGALDEVIRNRICSQKAVLETAEDGLAIFHDNFSILFKSLTRDEHTNHYIHIFFGLIYGTLWLESAGLLRISYRRFIII